MQAPPTPLQRNTLPVPSRRQTLSRTSSFGPTPISQLLTAALAIVASRTWVLDDEAESSGGAGWLVLSLWVGRCGVEARRAVRRRRGEDVGTNGLGVSTTAHTPAVTDGVSH
jgi:hypothetical protein